MPKSTRQAFGESLVRLGETHPQIVTLDADLAKSTMSHLFMKKFPERFFEMGIAEANMIGTAAGLAFTGKLPFLCSFGCFLTGRYDTIRLSAAYSQADIRLVGTHAGVGIGDDGHSQMGLEDITLMRALPTMGVFQPMDGRETELVMDYLVKTWKGPAYLRLTRQALPDLLTDASSWKPTKLYALKNDPSAKVAIIASGAPVGEAVAAAGMLQKSGISASVWNAHCLKPFDDETTASIARQAKLIVSVEDHTVIGGLGTCVAETLANRGLGARLVKVGIQDVFGESGDPVELYEKHGLTAAKIAERVSAELNR